MHAHVVVLCPVRACANIKRLQRAAEQHVEARDGCKGACSMLHRPLESQLCCSNPCCCPGERQRTSIGRAEAGGAGVLKAERRPAQAGLPPLP